MKRSLLDMVQDILSDMTSDEVNSIGDTQESLQVANLIKTTYFSMMSSRNWAHLRKSIQLESHGTLDRPTHMRLPEGTKELCLLNYNKQLKDETRRRFTEVFYQDPDTFLRRINGMNSDSDEVIIVEDLTGVELLIGTDAHPQYFTSFDDKNVVFDSYLAEGTSTMQASRVQAMAYVTPDWVMDDEFIPDLPAEAFAALLAEAKSRAFLRIGQQADSKAEQEATRQNKWLSRKNRRIASEIQYPNYGRGSKK